MLTLSNELFGKIPSNEIISRERKQSQPHLNFQIPSIPKGLEIHFNLKDSFSTKLSNTKVTKEEDRWHRFEFHFDFFSFLF